MRKILKKYFIPHHGNDYRPHILRGKRTLFYGLVFLLVKVILIAFVVLLPAEVYVMPDVLAEEGKQIIALTNEVRINEGLSVLTVADKLNLSAQYKADDMSTREYFSHNDSNKSVSAWLRTAGYDFEEAGENLAVGFSSAEDIVNAWKNSPAHYANLVDRDFINLGVGLSGGVYNGQPTVYIAQHFAVPLSSKEMKEPIKVIAKADINKNLIYQTNEIKKEIIQEEVLESTTTTALEMSVNEENVVPTATPVMNLVDSTPFEKYSHAKSVLSPITSIFDVSRNIYLAAILFFAVALLLNIFVEIRKQHPHVIFHTSCLIALLIVFWKF